ncbi:MAG: MarR family transcriptional regulator [Pseudomonadota bacterium]
MVERRVDEGLKRHGLTRIGWCILLAVEDEGKTNPSDIADFVGIDRTATSRALKHLEASGLIQRTMGREDRRMTHVALTETGRRHLRASVPLCIEALAQSNSRMSETELAELKRLLTIVVEDTGH